MRRFAYFVPGRPVQVSHALLALLVAVASCPAMAVLGEAWPEASAAQANAVSTTKHATQRAAVQYDLYAVHESQLDNGTTVKEYTNADAKVFAVSWSGPVLPDLQALLGGHFEAFSAGASKARKPGSPGTPLNLEQEKLVVRSSGRMGHFLGHAYAPDLIPTGVNINELLR